ncbi:MAG: SulP family inorganic anion transporter [Myxococcales bacterium]|nr:SulP family inorganic anion transporter [Myxococcales bacterium]
MSTTTGSKVSGGLVFSEVLASVVVFLVALPLCMGIAVASGVPPIMGLVSGIIGGLVVGSIAGSPLQVSGPAAGLAVIVWDIVHEHGLEALGPILLVAGLLQVVAGKLRLGQWFRAVAPAVIYAMLAGIGILIVASQVHVMVDAAPQSNGLVNLATIPSSLIKAVAPPEGTNHHLAAGVAGFTMAILVGWGWARPRLPTVLATIPAPLLAVVGGVGAAALFDLNIAYVAVPDSLSGMVRLPTVESMSLLAQPAVLGAALAMAAIASAEALLCAVAVDKLTQDVPSDLDQELFAQGIGNTLAGFVGALPVTGVIVRSTANVESGGSTRWSAILHGLWLLLAVAAVPVVLEQIPIASLAAVLVYIGFKLVNPTIPRQLLARGRGELAIYLTTVAAIVSVSLLEGLLIGFALSLLKLAWSFSRLDVQVEEQHDRIDLRLRGSGTFVGLPILAKALDGVPKGNEVHLHLEDVDFVDHACFELLSDWRAQYEGSGGTVVLEWDTLEERGVYRMRSDAA